MDLREKQVLQKAVFSRELQFGGKKFETMGVHLFSMR